MSSEHAVRAVLVCLQFLIGILLANVDISSSGAEEGAAPAGEALYQQRCGPRVTRAP
jgi:hypothetical protein